MCGLAGYVNYTELNKIAELANAIQFHRGPDHQGTYLNENTLICSQRLSIIDLDQRSNQPFKKHDLVIAFTGEIYNYRELKEELRSEHNTGFQTESDTEVILELYNIYGEKCLDYLLGMFVIAIYDIKKRSIFIARDHFGIKPLFYFKKNNSFAFASELKTLIQTTGSKGTINRSALVAGLNYLWIPEQDSIFKEFKKLPPGHYLNFRENGDFKITKYYHLPTECTDKPENEVVEEFRSVIESSIKRHLVSDVEVSSFLSGGLDSSLISVIAGKSLPKLSTYTIGTLAEDKKVERMPDDQKYAKIIAEKYGFDHHEIIIEPNIVDLLPKIVYSLDEPIGDPAAINTYLISRAAHERGVKVLLSGMGADEILFGYRRQIATLLAQKYKKLPGGIRGLTKELVNIMPTQINNRGLKITRWAKRFLNFADLPLEQAYQRSYSYYDIPHLRNLFNDIDPGDLENLRTQHNNIFESVYAGDPINQMCFTDINMFMPGLNLTYTDRASMAASVEVRVPFIDRKVVEAAMRIPGDLKYKNKQSKYILKKVAEKYLPKKIIYRPKASFGAPIRSWIKGALRPMVLDLLSEETIKRRGIFNYKEIDKIITNDLKGREDNAYQIYYLLTLELWFQAFLDKS